MRLLQRRKTVTEMTHIDGARVRVGRLWKARTGIVVGVWPDGLRTKAIAVELDGDDDLVTGFEMSDLQFIACSIDYCHRPSVTDTDGIELCEVHEVEAEAIDDDGEPKSWDDEE